MSNNYSDEWQLLYQEWNLRNRPAEQNQIWPKWYLKTHLCQNEIWMMPDARARGNTNKQHNFSWKINFFTKIFVKIKVTVCKQQQIHIIIICEIRTEPHTNLCFSLLLLFITTTYTEYDDFTVIFKCLFRWKKVQGEHATLYTKIYYFHQRYWPKFTENILKSVFFLRSESGLEFKSFPAKKYAYDCLTYLFYQLEACFFGGKPLKLISWLGSQKKLTLGKTISIQNFFPLSRLVCFAWS